MENMGRRNKKKTKQKQNKYFINVGEIKNPKTFTLKEKLVITTTENYIDAINEK